MSKIAKEGIYDRVPMDLYQGDCCDGPAIGGSGLVLIERACPAIYWVTSPYNPQRIEREETPALLFGRAFHCLTLEGEVEFNRLYRIKPEGLDGRTREGKAWIADNSEPGIALLSFEQGEAIRAMRDAVMAHPGARKAFSDGKPEQSMFVKDKPTGIWLRARPDWLGNSSRFIPNLKSTICAKADVFEADAHRRGYHQSAALTQDIARELGIADPVPFLVIQEKEPPYLVEIATFQDDALEWGRILNRKALDTFARCIEAGEWPGYSDNVIEIKMPKWMEYRLMDRSAAGEFQAPPDPEFTDVRNILAGA